MDAVPLWTLQGSSWTPFIVAVYGNHKKRGPCPDPPWPPPAPPSPGAILITHRTMGATDHMVRTASLMVPLGTKAPDFELPEVDGSTVRRSDFDGKPLLVVFQCNHCPYVKHVRREFADLARGYMDKGVAVVGISSNDVEQYPDDSPDAMKKEKKEIGYPYPYLFDETQDVAKAYRATCTPDFFLFDKDHRLVYRGQLDDSRPDSGIPVTGKDLTTAVEAMLAGKEPPQEQKPSMGCNVKWRPGNEPDWWQSKSASA